MNHCIYCGKQLQGETICPRCGKPILPFRSLEEFSYTVFPTEQANEFASKKVGLFSKGDQKKLVEAIQNGNAETVEVRIEKTWIHTVSSGEDEWNYAYANLADLTDHPSPLAVQVLGDLPNENEIGLLFRFLKKKTWSYAVFSKESGSRIADYTSAILDLQGNGTLDRELPILEGSVADQVGNFLGGLFKKKS